MAEYKHILFAADLSDETQQIGEQAVNLARRYEAKISLIHVVEHLGVSGPNELAPSVPPGSADDSVQKARDALAQLAQRLGIPDAERWVIASSATKDEIHRVAREQGVDLIVVGSHGRHGLALLLGSTASAMLHDAPCDVLAVRIKT